MLKGFAHKCTALLLTFILVAHNINTLVIVGNFIANQDFIAKNLCVQKDNQQGCNGKCHLREQLAQNESHNSENAPPQETKRVMLDVYCFSEVNTIGKQNIILPQKDDKWLFKMPIFHENTVAIDTPPPIV